MRFFSGAVALAVGLMAPSLVAAAPSADRDIDLEIRGDVEARAPPTCHSASNRACWTTGFNINTDYELTAPPPGTTRKVGAITVLAEGVDADRNPVHAQPHRRGELGRS